VSPVDPDGPESPGSWSVHLLADHGVRVDGLRASEVTPVAAALRSSILGTTRGSMDQPSGHGRGGGPSEHPAGGAPARTGGDGPLGAVDDVVVSSDSVLVLAAADGADTVALAELVTATVASATGIGAGTVVGDGTRTGAVAPAASESDVASPPAVGAPVVLPVSFDGPDLATVGALSGLGADGVVTAMLAASFTVAFMGFTPGFAYLTGLPPALAAIPRRARPRPRVPPGSLAIGGGHAAIYPHASPGGWHLLGTTDAVLFDPVTPPYALLGPGQAVRFVPAGDAGTHLRRHREPPGAAADDDGAGTARPGARRTTPLRSTAPRTMVVEAAGSWTTVQDGGRRHVASLGVPVAGPADRIAHLVANRLVGNADGDGAIEVTVTGPTLLLRTDAVVAVVGDVPVLVDDRAAPVATALPLAGGQRLRVGTCRTGVRAVIAVAGGVEVPGAVGSVSSDGLCGLGVGRLVPGDVLGLGTPRRTAGHLTPRALERSPLATWASMVGLGGVPPTPVPVHVVAGPDSTPDLLRWLTGTPWVVADDADRIGVRLTRPTPLGRAPAPAAPTGTGATTSSKGDTLRATAVSRPVTTGVVQLPPDGHPVILLCDHATVGGYPVVATAIVADIPLVAQLRPGASVALVECTAAGAVERRRAIRQLLDGTATWSPTLGS
jgi:biotin-dependent carboxylase-like uncharacterized protein